MQKTREPNARKLIHLAAHFPGSFDTTLWTDPACSSMIEFESFESFERFERFESFERFARTVERGRFDHVFLAEELPWPRAEAPSIPALLSRIES